MPKPDNNLPVRIVGREVILDFHGKSKGIQTKVVDLLRTLKEAFGQVNTRNRHVMVELKASAESVLDVLNKAFVQQGLRLRPVLA